MNYGYYPGCSLTGTAKEFDSSVRAVLSRFNIQFDDINDWSCCGATSAHATSHLLSVALPAKNLIQAKKQGLEKVFAPCAACFNRLITSRHEIDTNKAIKSKVESILEEEYTSSPEVLNIVQLFHNIGLNEITTQKQQDLSGLKVACYYGCLLVRPDGITGQDDMEEPKMMEEVAAAAGAKTVKWNYKTECCGASHSIAHTNIVETLSKKIIDDAQKHGADVIITACPMCHSNLDMRQLSIKKHNPEHKFIPVLYLTQLVGLALGIMPENLGMNLHFIDPIPLIKSKMLKEAVI